jgi:hypothetical protein
LRNTVLGEIEGSQFTVVRSPRPGGEPLWCVLKNHG